MKNTIALFLKLSMVSMGVIAFLALSGVEEAKAQSGKTLYQTKGCAACHGPGGKAPIMPVYPKLAGQNAAYLDAQMKAFKDQSRKNGMSALMWGMAAGLSTGDMKAISKYLSKVK